jgi:FlaG/FlaF family flagellin (archaellin)
MSDWTLLGSINHNFGHCNTVHYDDVHDTLLIGNLPGTQSLPSALYIFYNVSSWASESSLDFDTLSPSIVDVSDTVSATVSAFWADNSIGIRNQVYIMKAYGAGKFAKIVLGMGTNQLTYGTYDSTHAGSGQFNGTYDIVIAGVDIQYPSNDGNKNVIQGGDYAKGRVITANGHDQIYGRIWAIQENVYGEKSINSTFIESVPRKADGTIDYSVGEGLCVKDGYVYHGIIKMTDDFRHTPQTVTGYYLAKYPLPY